MWYLVLSRTVRTEAEMQPRTQPHLDWLFEQHRLGRALFSGRTSARDYGIYVLLAESLDAARALAAEDPYHVYGDREMQVLEWNPQRAMRLDVSIAAIEAMARHGAPRPD
jgi:uncharacterized protein YciI